MCTLVFQKLCGRHGESLIAQWTEVLLSVDSCTRCFQQTVGWILLGSCDWTNGAGHTEAAVMKTKRAFFGTKHVYAAGSELKPSNPIDHYHLPSLLGVLHWVWWTSCSANVITNVSPHCGHFHTFCRWSPNCAHAVTVASSCRLVHMWQRECWVS